MKKNLHFLHRLNMLFLGRRGIWAWGELGSGCQDPSSDVSNIPIELAINLPTNQPTNQTSDQPCKERKRNGQTRNKTYVFSLWELKLSMLDPK